MAQVVRHGVALVVTVLSVQAQVVRHGVDPVVTVPTGRADPRRGEWWMAVPSWLVGMGHCVQVLLVGLLPDPVPCSSRRGIPRRHANGHGE